MLLIDFETRSHCDLKAAGTERYVRHPTTEAICCGFKDGEREWMWYNQHIYTKRSTNIWPRWVRTQMADPDIIVAAHNAAFDRGIWKAAAFQAIAFDRWYCTSAMARVNGLPASLDDAARALNSMHRKDYRGAELIRKCSVPPYDESEESLEAMAEYCMQDLRVQADLVERCRPLTRQEHQDWLVNERINQRGVMVDRFLAEQATHYAEEETEAIRAELMQYTNGRISGHAQHQRIKNWLLDQFDLLDDPEPAKRVTVRYKNGEKKTSTDKAVRQELLGRADELDLTAATRYVLELINNGNLSSVSKFEKMLLMSTPEDPRIRGAFMYAGAASTLRYSSRGLQLHNMVRDCFGEAEAEDLAERMAADAPLEDVMTTLSKLLRPAMVPAPGHVFVVGDWSAIEAMGLPYLAEAEDVLELFRQGKDIYVETAARMGDDFDRQMGKVATLSLGFGGGKGAFAAMGRNYGVFLPEHKAQRVVDRWRATNRWASDPQRGFWARLKRAALAAVRHPYNVVTAGKHVAYIFTPTHLGGTLLCRLPGDTLLSYPQCRIEEDDYGEPVLTSLKAAWTPKADAREWPRVRLWHGVLVENVTQAFCASILRWALDEFDTFQEDDSGGVVMHTHDEVVIETPTRFAEDVCAYMTCEMNKAPPFAPGLPLRAEPKIMTRYGK